MGVRTCASFALTVVLTTCFASRAWSADRYVVNAAHARLGFAVSHLMINRVRGAFDAFSVTIIYNADDITWSSMCGVINAASIATAQRKRDGHLRSGDFPDAANHPPITCETTPVDAGDDSPVLHGILTMRGVCAEVAIPFRLTGVVELDGETRLGFETRLHLNRQDYGVSCSRLIDTGGLVAGDDVFIEGTGEAIRATDG